MRTTVATAVAVSLCLILSGGSGIARDSGNVAATPEQLVATYDSLADTILSAKQSEWNLVHAILATTYGHAEATVAAARAKLQAGADARAEIETIAALVTQLGNEGDASVAAIRKRLVEGGHHHNAKGEQQGTFDQGFIIVTRSTRKALLDSAKRIAKLGARPGVAALDAEWTAVRQAFAALHENVPGMS